MQSNNITPTTPSFESKGKNQDALVVQEKQPDSLVIKQSEKKLIVDVPKAIVSYFGEGLKQKLAEVQSGDYKLDQWEFKPFGSVFKEGDILVQVVAKHPDTATCIISKPGSSSFFTNTDAFHSGNMYADMYTDLQMKEDPEWARKGFTMIYRLDKSFLEKFGHVYIGVGQTNNNPQYGSGGKTQFFIDNRHLKLLLSTKLTMSIEYPTETNSNKKGARTHHTITTLEWDAGTSSYNIKRQVKYECHIPHVIHMDAKQKNKKSVDPIEPSYESSVSTIDEQATSKPKVSITSLASEQKITSPVTKSRLHNVKSFRGIDTGSRTTQIFARLGGLRRMGGKSALGAFVAVGLYALAEKIGAITSVNAGEKIDEIQKLRAKTISNQMEEKSLIKELQKMEMELNEKIEKGIATEEDRAVLQKIQEELHVRCESDDDRSSSASEEKADSPVRPSRDGMFSQGIGSSFAAVGKPVVDSLSSVASTVIEETRDSVGRLADGSSVVAVQEESYRMGSPFGL